MHMQPVGPPRGFCQTMVGARNIGRSGGCFFFFFGRPTKELKGKRCGSSSGSGSVDCLPEESQQKSKRGERIWLYLDLGISFDDEHV